MRTPHGVASFRSRSASPQLGLNKQAPEPLNISSNRPQETFAATRVAPERSTTSKTILFFRHTVRPHPEHPSHTHTIESNSGFGSQAISSKNTELRDTAGLGAKRFHQKTRSFATQRAWEPNDFISKTHTIEPNSGLGCQTISPTNIQLRDTAGFGAKRFHQKTCSSATRRAWEPNDFINKTRTCICTGSLV